MNKSVEYLLNSIQNSIEMFSEKINDRNIEIGEANLDVKHILEDMQSVLDYIAVAIHKKYCFDNKLKKIYFIYAKSTDDEQNFKERINKYFPGLCDKCKVIYDELINVQSFRDKSNWIIKLNDLANVVKHNDLYIVTVVQEKNIALETTDTLLLVKGDSVIKKYGNGFGVYGEGSVYISGNSAVNIYDDGIVTIGEGVYNLNNNKMENMKKNVFYKNVLMSAKYKEDILVLLNIFYKKELSLYENIEKYSDLFDI